MIGPVVVFLVGAFVGMVVTLVASALMLSSRISRDDEDEELQAWYREREEKQREWAETYVSKPTGGYQNWIPKEEE
jgi:mannitol-specific phosphotransferase system IIBC component